MQRCEITYQPTTMVPPSLNDSVDSVELCSLLQRLGIGMPCNSSQKGMDEKRHAAEEGEREEQRGDVQVQLQQGVMVEKQLEEEQTCCIDLVESSSNGSREDDDEDDDDDDDSLDREVVILDVIDSDKAIRPSHQDETARVSDCSGYGHHPDDVSTNLPYDKEWKELYSSSYRLRVIDDSSSNGGSGDDEHDVMGSGTESSYTDAGQDDDHCIHIDHSTHLDHSNTETETTGVSISSMHSTTCSVNSNKLNQAEKLGGIHASRRAVLSANLYKKYNAQVFDYALPKDLDISWNSRLTTTAGLTHYKRVWVGNVMVYSARIELSIKVVDTVAKLESTLVHEMCHVAAWLIDHVAKPPHGAVFKKYAMACKIRARMDVSTCHQYDIFKPYRWQCVSCYQEYSRHSKSIDVSKKACGVCRGQLSYLGKFGRDGSPVKRVQRTNEYSAFVKEKFPVVKSTCPPGTASSEVMKKIAALWKSPSKAAMA